MSTVGTSGLQKELSAAVSVQEEEEDEDGQH